MIKVFKSTEKIEKYNPYHDERGRFTSATGGASFSYPKSGNLYNATIKEGIKVFSGGGKPGERNATTGMGVKIVNGKVVDDTKEEVKSNFGSKIQGKSLGEHGEKIARIVENSDTEVKKLFQNFEDKIHFESTTYKSTPEYFNGRLYLNLEDVAKGNAYRKPYETLVHEVGHAIDNAAGKMKGNTKVFNDMFSNTLNLAGSVKKEWEAMTKKRTEEIQSANPNKRIIRVHGKFDVINEMKKAIPDADRAAISDMIAAATSGDFSLGVGHGKAYWTKSNLPLSGSTKKAFVNQTKNTEIFANITAALMTNKGSADAIEKYFPETMKAYKAGIEKLNKEME